MDRPKLDERTKIFGAIAIAGLVTLGLYLVPTKPQVASDVTPATPAANPQVLQNPNIAEESRDNAAKARQDAFVEWKVNASQEELDEMATYRRVRESKDPMIQEWVQRYESEHHVVEEFYNNPGVNDRP